MASAAGCRLGCKLVGTMAYTHRPHRLFLLKHRSLKKNPETDMFTKHDRWRQMVNFTKVHVQAQHYSWTDQGVVSWNIQPGAVKLVFWRHWMHLRYMHPVTSEDTIHCTRLYQVNTQSHGYWACATELGNCIKGRPYNVKTIQWGPEFLPTFLAEYDIETFYCDSRVKLSVLLKALLCSVRLGPA